MEKDLTKFQFNSSIYLLIPLIIFVIFIYLGSSYQKGSYNVFSIPFFMYIIFSGIITIVLLFQRISLKFKMSIIFGFLIISLSGMVNSSLFDENIFENKIDLDVENQTFVNIYLEEGKEYSLFEIMKSQVNIDNAPNYLEINIIDGNGNKPLFYKENRCIFDDLTYLKTFKVNKTSNYRIEINLSIQNGWRSIVESVKIIIKENSMSKHTLPFLGFGIIISIIGIILNINEKNKSNGKVTKSYFFDFNENKRNKKYKESEIFAHFKDDFIFLKNFGLNFQIGFSNSGIIFISRPFNWPSKIVLAKYIKWIEIKEISKKMYPGWGYTSFRNPRGEYHLPLLVGNWCIILNNGERHSLGLINNKNAQILLKNFKKYKSFRVNQITILI